MERGEVIARIRRFLDRIGIQVEERTLPEGTFLPGVCIERGLLLIDHDRLAHPGDLLHEAGHIALERPSRRHALGQDVLDARPAHMSEELGVILWTFFAANEIEIPIDEVFHAGGYEKDSNWIMERLSAGELIGLPLLVWMGVVEQGSGAARVCSWLRTTEPTEPAGLP